MSRKSTYRAVQIPGASSEIYDTLRNQVLTCELDAKGDKPELLAVLMETGYPEAVATLVAVADGSVSLYFSNGGGIIGAGEHARVQQEARKLLSVAEGFVSSTSLTETFPLPLKGHVRFYLVTVGGTYSVEATEDDLVYRRHLFAPLFHQGHGLITATREHAPQ